MNSKKIKLALSLLILSHFIFLKGDNMIYDNKITKNRAEKFKDTGGVSKAGKLYVYKDDKSIKKELDELKKNPNKNKKGITISGVTIKKNQRIKEVNVVINTKKEIKIDTRKLKTKDIKIGTVTLEQGARVKKTNILIDAKRIAIK